jgi:CBS domain-containing protein
MTSAQRNLKTKDVMVCEPVCVDPSMTVRQLARIFEENEISGVPVVDTEGHVIGIASKTDLIRRCAEGTPDIPPAYLFEVAFEQNGQDEELILEPPVCVEDVMTHDPVSVTPNTPVGDVARLMADKRIHRVVVVDDERFLVGIITSLDLLGVLSTI